MTITLRGVKGSALTQAEVDRNFTDLHVFVSVKEHDAVGDGVTDDTAAIQAAIDAVELTGGVLHFPKGTYLVSESTTNICLLLDADNVTISGEGRKSVIKTTADANILRVSGANNIVIRDISFLGDDDALKTAQDGVRCINVTDVLVHNVHVKDVGHDGILLISGCVGCTVSDCHVDGCDDDGINIGGDPVSTTQNTTVTGNVVENVANDGIHVSDGSLRTAVTGNAILNCGNGVGLFKCSRVAISGNSIFNSTDYGIHDPSGAVSHLSITGNVIELGERGIYLAASTHFSIVGNTIRAPTDYGIVLSGASLHLDMDAVISGNAIDSGCSVGGIFLSGVRGAAITGNAVADVTGDGIFVNSDATFGCADIVISDNIIRDAGDEGIEVESGADSEHITICRNIIRSPTGRAIEYRGGPYFAVSHNRAIDASDFAIVVSATSLRAGKGVVEGNIIEGGCTTAGMQINNYDEVLVRSNVVYDITSATAISVPAGNVVIEGNLAEDAITGGSQGPLIAAAPAATTLGSVAKKIEVFDANGASLGFLPVYDAITT